LQSDLVELLEATIDRRLAAVSPRWCAESAVCVIMASGGYPEAYTSGKEINGLGSATATVFHAGTRRDGDRIVTAGGRVIGVTTLASTLAEARDRAYAAVGQISFERAHFRKDIAVKGL
jgi:phosphoribosylamine--glycine ligase